MIFWGVIVYIGEFYILFYNEHVCWIVVYKSC